MKSGKRPTKKQKMALAGAGEDPQAWLIVKNLPSMLHIVHRKTGEQKSIKKEGVTT